MTDANKQRFTCYFKSAKLTGKHAKLQGNIERAIRKDDGRFLSKDVRHTFKDAVWSGDTTLVNLFLQANESLLDSSIVRRPAMWEAVSAGDENMIRFLIGKGANVDIRGQGYSLAEFAMHRGINTDIVQVLIDRTVNLHRPDFFGNTPLHTAAGKPSGDVDPLLAAGADVNAANNQGKTPIYEAILNSNDQSITKLIAAGANVNHRDNWGTTPLLLALRVHIDCALLELFIDAGADVNVVNERGETPLGLASRMSPPLRDRVVEKLVSLGDS